MEYIWISVLSAAVFAAEIAVAYRIRNCQKTCVVLATLFALYALTAKTVEFASYRINGIAQYPVEFSHVSYFVLGVVALSGIKVLRPFASFCALLTGTGYLIALMLSPQSMATGFRSTGYFLHSVFVHNCLFAGGLLFMLGGDRFRYKNFYISLAGFICILGFADLVRAGVIYKDITYKDDIILLKIMDGRILEYVVDPQSLTPALKGIAVAAIFVAVVALMALIYFISNKVCDKRLKKRGETPPFKTDFGLVPLAVKIYGRVKARTNI